MGMFGNPRIILSLIFTLLYLPSLSAGSDEMTVELQQAKDSLSLAYEIATQIQDIEEYRIDSGMFVTAPVKGKLKLLDRIALAQLRAGHREGSRGAFHAMLQIINNIRDQYLRDKTLGELAESQATAGEIEEALGTLQLIEEEGNKIYPLIKVAAAQWMKSNPAAAQATLRKAFQIAKTDETFRNIFFHIGVAQARVGDFSGAIESADAGLPLSRPGLLGEIAAVRIRAKDTKSALDIVHLVSGDQDKAKILKKILLAQMEVDPNGAERTLQRWLEIVGKLKNDDSIFEMAGYYATSGKQAEAFQLVRKIQSESKRGTGLTLVVNLLKAQPHLARFEITHARQIALEIQHDNVRGRVLLEIAKAQSELGDQKGVLQTAGLIMKHAENIPVEVLTKVAALQKEAGDSKAAKQTMQRAVSNFEKSKQTYELSPIISTFIELDDLDSAMQLVERKQIKHDGILLRIASAQVQSGNLKGAFETITPIEGLPERAMALAELAKDQALMGDSPAAELSLQQALLLAKAVKDPEKRRISLGVVLSDLWTSGTILGGLTYELAKEGKVSVARQVVEKLTFPYLKARSLLGIAEGILDGVGIKEIRLIELYDPPIV